MNKKLIERLAREYERAGRTLPASLRGLPDRTLELHLADIRKAGGDGWIPAGGGTEVPITARDGRRVLYVYRPITGEHAYLDLGRDMIISEAEARAILE